MEKTDIVKISKDSGKAVTAGRPSMELKVHRRIYRLTGCRAVVHAHPPAATAMAFRTERIRPCDDEGKYYIPEVPVLAAEKTIASEEVASRLPELLRECPAAVVRGHGAFAAGSSLREAASLLSSLEFSCRISLLNKQWSSSQ